MACTSIAAAGLGAPLTVSVKDLSASSSFRTTNASCFVKKVSARVVCSAAKEDTAVEKVGKVASAVALAAIISTATFAAPQEALADVAGLTPCAESKAFAKRQKQAIKKLETRLKNYAPDSAPALALQATIEKTKTRFSNYGKQGLLCGTDGLPHLIVDGDLNHLGEFVYPGLIFLYVAGWIGWVGRAYLIAIRSAKKPTEKEIIIDVPLALSILPSGLTWPVAAYAELKNGDLLESADKITVSPR